MPRRNALLKIDIAEQRSRRLVRPAHHHPRRRRRAKSESCSRNRVEPGVFQQPVKRAPNKKHTQERYDSKPDSRNQHTERPRRHILLSLQIIFGLLYAAVSAYIVGETSKPVEKAAFIHDGPAGSWAMLGGIGLILGGGCAFIGLVLLIG